MLKFFRITLTMVLAAGPAYAADQVESVSWEQVGQAIGDTICLREQAQMPSGYIASWGDRKACGLDSPPTALDEAIKNAFASSQTLMTSIGDLFSVLPPGLDEAWAAESPSDRQRLAAEAFLEHEPFLRALVPRLDGELAKQGFACSGCPAFEPPAERKLTWEEFSPYVSAFIRPHADLAGFHLCSGVDAAEHVSDPDMNLLRAGFLAARNSQSLLQRTGDVLDKRRNDAALLALQDEVRIARLHEDIVGVVKGDSEIRLQACDALEPYAADLGVVLTDCETSTTSR